MNTQHPHIEELERFALDRNSLPPDRMRSVEEHLGHCSYCRDLVGEIGELRRCVDEADEDLVARETDRIMRLLHLPKGPARNETILHFRPLPTVEAGSAGYALAAKSEDTRADYLPIATLYSDDGQTLLRILHETGHASYLFQLMSEKSDHVPHALLVAPGKNPMMTDSEGSLRVSDTELDIVQIVSMSVFYPLVRMQTGPVKPDELTSHEGVLLASEDSTVHMQSDGSGLDVRVRWHGSGDTAPRYCGAVGRDMYAVSVIDHDRTHLPLTSLPDDSMLLLY